VTDHGVELPFSGIPFVFLGNRTLACHHGPDLNKTTKVKQRDCRVANSVSRPTTVVFLLFFYCRLQF